MEKQISIIIPTYNMEQYIGKCLDSLLIPEFDQVEVLVVNDGSRDRSSEIAHSYAEHYPCSIRVIDKPNGNYGSCINAALPLCTGRYVKILDADDTFDTAAFSRLLRLLPSCSEDVLITSFDKIDTDGNVVESNTLDIYILSAEKTYRLKDFHAKYCYIPMHRIAYNRDIFSRVNYRQSEGISYTDVQWSIVLMSYCDTIRFIELPVYRYLTGREGQTMDPKQRAKSLDSLFKVADGLNYYYINAGDNCRKDILFTQIVGFHKTVYFEVIGSTKIDAMQMMRRHDVKILNTIPELYDAIGRINYDRYSSFKVFQDIRKKNYPEKYRIPFGEALMLSLKVKLNRLFNK